jgi:signal transduction histidine kinase
MTITDRTLVWIVRAAAAAGVVLVVSGLVISATTYSQPFWQLFWSNGLGLAVLLSGFFGVFVWLVIPQQPRNAVVWTMALSGFASGFYIGGYGLAVPLVANPDALLSDAYVPASVPVASALLVMAATAGVYVALFAWLTFGMLLFPDGKVRSSRWGWVAGFAATGILLMVASTAWEYRPSNTLPVRDDALLTSVGILIAAVASVLSLVALILRFRESRGATRAQFKWVVWGASILVPAFAVAFVVRDAGDTLLILVHVAAAVMLVSYAMAVTKYRLYDIDIVISKTVAFVSLGAVIAVLYVAAVFGLVALFEPDQRVVDLGAGFWFGATALVAIVFEPLRVRLQRWANRVAYGQRAAPHEVLSRLTSQLSDTSSGAGLVGLARLLREGTGAESAFVWLRVGDRLRVEAASPADTQPSVFEVEAEEDLPASEVELSVPVRHGGELLGALGVTKPRSHPVTPADQALLSDVAAGAGLLLRNLRLNAELANRAVQLQASRRRLIAAHDAARHRLERDLHDGAQQQVVALKVRLGLAKTIAEREGAHELAVRVADLADGTQQAVDAMRIVARGIYPPLLDAEGLGPALTAMHRAVDLPVEIGLGTLPRYSKEVEETVYFCVLAAVTRAKMAGATSAQVEVHGDNAVLAVTVSYDAAERGDLTALTDRVDAFGGTVTTTTAAEVTTITLALPINTEVMEPA